MGIGNILTVRHLDQNPSYLYLSNIESMIRTLLFYTDPQNLRFKYEEVDTPPRAHHQLYRMCLSCKDIALTRQVASFLTAEKISYCVNGVTQLVIEAQPEKMNAYSKYAKKTTIEEILETEVNTASQVKHESVFHGHRGVSLLSSKNISEELNFINVMISRHGLSSKIISRKGSVLSGVLSYSCESKDAVVICKCFQSWGYSESEACVVFGEDGKKIVMLYMRHRKLDPYPGKARKKE